MRRLIALAFVVIATPVLSAPLGPPGQTAVYELSADPAERPAFERENRLTVVRARLHLGGEETVGERRYQWFVLQFERENGERYRAALLMDGWPGESEPDVARYLWQEPGWPDALEYVHETTGQPVLPRLEMFRYGFPREPEGGPLAAPAQFPDGIFLHGYPFDRGESQTLTPWRPPVAVTRLALNPDLLIGHIREHVDSTGRPDPAMRDNYQFLDADETYLRGHIDAGFNLQMSKQLRPDWVWRSPHFVGMPFSAPEDWPAHLYRSNFWGRGMYVDEPGIHWRGHANRIPEYAGTLSPAEGASEIKKYATSVLWKESNNYSAIWINKIVGRHFGLGNMVLREDDYPYWEAIWYDAWYLLAPEYSAWGICTEGETLSTLVYRYNMAFGTAIPPTIENACRLRAAVLRGACRAFGGRWGTAVYRPVELQAKRTAIHHDYHAGATYFWFWSGYEGAGAHVPYTYQRSLAETIRQVYREHPNRDMEALLHAGSAAIVLPMGFTFYPHNLQSVRWLHLERTTDAGASYRDVLAAAALEAERMLRAGILFDIVVNDKRADLSGYEELIMVDEDATVGRIGGEQQQLPQEPMRATLGEGPSIAVEIARRPEGICGEARLIADPRAGTGELAADIDGQPLVMWELYGPDDGCDISFGPELAFEARTGGDYRVRASCADIFGRPTSVWTELTVEGGREIDVLPEVWRFRLDPENQGVARRWFAADIDDADWREIPVPAWWEKTEVGEYDGHAWYRVRFTIPEEVHGTLQLLFLGVDEQAWVYLNGKAVGERTSESTGMQPADYWDEPFVVRLDDAWHAGENTLVVRVHDSERAGGIFQPVRLLVFPE
ncbi:MAG: sugar-binding domain-containing protein [Armatimonadota bacterium]|jgi:hypothetical protein